MQKSKGFTLIELMIVIAIIAIIAAIAIPGLLSSQRSANERNASASLKTLGTATMDFRSNDRDGDTITNFFVGNVQGYYTMRIPAATEAIKLIELPIGRADASPAAGVGLYGPSAVEDGNAAAAMAPAAAKSGYWFGMLVSFADSAGVPVAYNLAGTGRNISRYGVLVGPDDYSVSGNNVFILDQGNTMYKQDGAAANAGSYTSGGSQGMVAGSLGTVVFPSSPTALGWSTMD